MRKILITALTVLTCIALFTSCAKKSEAVKNVQDLISALDGSDEAVSQAREAYNALSAAEKEQVKNVEKLENAEQKAAQIKDINADLSEILDAVDSSFSGSNFDVSGFIEKGNEIIEKYDSLSKEDKKKISADIDRINEALETLGTFTDTAEKGAAAYVKAFQTVNPGKEITAVYCLKQIRSDGEYHFYALTYKDGDKEINVYANARCTADVSAEAIAERADTFFASAPGSETYDPIINGNVTLELERVLELAK